MTSAQRLESPGPGDLSGRGRPTRHTLMRTLIVGAGEAGQALARDLAATPAFGLHPIGFLDDDPWSESPQVCLSSGALTELTAIALRMQIDVVVLAIPATRSRRVPRRGETEPQPRA